jgi:hypothetical protein
MSDRHRFDLPNRFNQIDLSWLSFLVARAPVLRLDPSLPRPRKWRGFARARELFELLAARGSNCRALKTGILDPERETSLSNVLLTLELNARSN